MSDISKDDYVFLPVEEAVSPRGGTYFQHYVDHWWVVHPEHGLLFYNRKNRRTGRRWQRGLGSPQCNTDERISKMVGDKTLAILWPDIEIRQFPSVWVPINISDYC